GPVTDLVAVGRDRRLDLGVAAVVRNGEGLPAGYGGASEGVVGDGPLDDVRVDRCVLCVALLVVDRRSGWVPCRRALDGAAGGVRDGVLPTAVCGRGNVNVPVGGRSAAVPLLERDVGSVRR